MKSYSVYLYNGYWHHVSPYSRPAVSATIIVVLIRQFERPGRMNAVYIKVRLGTGTEQPLYGTDAAVVWVQLFFQVALDFPFFLRFIHVSLRVRQI